MNQIILNKKQSIAHKILNDKSTNIIVYGGAKAGGKTFLDCVWLVEMCTFYPGTRWLLGRARLSDLKRTTLNTLIEVINKFGLNKNVKINFNTNKVIFWNNSEIILSDLYLYPTDPDFTSLGGLELTGAVIDEANEITEKAYKILKTCIRYKLTEYNLIPKLLISSNPTKNWLYKEIYLPYKNNTLPNNIKYIPATLEDNLKNLNKDYVNEMRHLTGVERERLYLGNWDYDANDDNLYSYDDLYNMFYNIKNIQNNTDTYYLTVDVAGTGKDNTIITIWNSYNCVSILKYKNIDTVEIVKIVKELIQKYRINIYNCIVDSNGIGKGVGDYLPGIIKFIAQEKQIDNTIYKNLKSQLFYKFAEKIKDIKINCESEYQEIIIQELINHKKWKIDTDNKLMITPKDEVKKSIGRSPDFADALTMRMYFELKKLNKTTWY